MAKLDELGEGGGLQARSLGGLFVDLRWMDKKYNKNCILNTLPVPRGQTSIASRKQQETTLPDPQTLLSTHSFDSQGFDA